MGQLARFTLLHRKRVQNLDSAAIPKRRIFRKPLYRFDEYLEEHGTDLGFFDDGDGNYVYILLRYLKCCERVNLIDGNKGLRLMADSLERWLQGFYTFFIDEDRRKAEDVLLVEFNPKKLSEVCSKENIDFDLYNDIGTFKMAQRRIAGVLAAIPDDHVVLLAIG